MTREVIEEKREKDKEKWILAAFVGFQMGAGGEMAFGKYLESLHLAPETVTATPKESAAEIIAGAEETLRIMREKAAKKAEQ